MDYLKNEQDTRGFVEEKGWAHSIAHGADLLASAVRHPQFKEKQIHTTLDTLHDCLFKDAAYIDEEDERLIFVLEALKKRGLDEIHLRPWIIQIVNRLTIIQEKEGFSINYFRKKFTITSFLKSLYFRMKFTNGPSSMTDLIYDCLQDFHQKSYTI